MRATRWRDCCRGCGAFEDLSFATLHAKQYEEIRSLVEKREGEPPNASSVSWGPDEAVIVGPDMALLATGRDACVQSYVEFEDEAGILRRYRKHVNGRGLVATTAKVGFRISWRAPYRTSWAIAPSSSAITIA